MAVKKAVRIIIFVLALLACSMTLLACDIDGDGDEGEGGININKSSFLKAKFMCSCCDEYIYFTSATAIEYFDSDGNVLLNGTYKIQGDLLKIDYGLGILGIGTDNYVIVTNDEFQTTLSNGRVGRYIREGTSGKIPNPSEIAMDKKGNAIKVVGQIALNTPSQTFTGDYTDGTWFKLVLSQETTVYVDPTYENFDAYLYSADDLSDMKIDENYQMITSYLAHSEYHSCNPAILPKGTYYVNLKVTGWFAKSVEGRVTVRTPSTVQFGDTVAVNSQTGNPVWYKMQVPKNTEAQMAIGVPDGYSSILLNGYVYSANNLSSVVLNDDSHPQFLNAGLYYVCVGGGLVTKTTLNNSSFRVFEVENLVVGQFSRNVSIDANGEVWYRLKVTRDTGGFLYAYTAEGYARSAIYSVEDVQSTSFGWIYALLATSTWFSSENKMYSSSYYVLPAGEYYVRVQSYNDTSPIASTAFCYGEDPNKPPATDDDDDGVGKVDEYLGAIAEFLKSFGLKMENLDRYVLGPANDIANVYSEVKNFFDLETSVGNSMEIVSIVADCIDFIAKTTQIYVTALRSQINCNNEDCQYMKEASYCLIKAAGLIVTKTMLNATAFAGVNKLLVAGLFSGSLPTLITGIAVKFVAIVTDWYLGEQIDEQFTNAWTMLAYCEYEH